MKKITDYMTESFRLRDDTELNDKKFKNKRLYREYEKCAREITDKFDRHAAIYDDLRNIFRFHRDGEEREFDVLLAVCAYSLNEEEYIASFVYDVDLYEYSTTGQVVAWTRDERGSLSSTVDPDADDIENADLFETVAHVFEDTYLSWDNDTNAIDFNDDTITFHVDFLVSGDFNNYDGGIDFLKAMSDEKRLFKFGRKNFKLYEKQYRELGFRYDYYLLRPKNYDKHSLRDIVDKFKENVKKYLK